MNISKSLIDLRDRARYQGQRLTQKARFNGQKPAGGQWPVLLGISFPKSGTNLLSQALGGFATIGPYADRSFDVFTVFDNATGKAHTAADALRFLQRLHPADIAQVHFYAWPEVVAAVCQPGYIPFFISRDPRDVVVSHMFYVTKMAREHVHHKYYAETLKTDEERLRTSILGRPEADVDFPDIAKRFEPYLGWLASPNVLCLRFEDFILDRPAALERVVDHYQRFERLPVSRAQALAALEESINPQKSRTFRGGRVGDWQKHFTPEHKALFKEVGGDLLIQLGYESGYDW